MPDRKGHYVRPAVRATAPGVIFSIAVDPLISADRTDAAAEFHSWGSAAASVVHRRNGRWIHRADAKFTEPAQLWAWMHEHCDRERRNYVFVPSVPDTLSISRFWEQVDPKDVKWLPAFAGQKGQGAKKLPPKVMQVRRVVLGRRVSFLDYFRFGVRWMWLSATNFFHADEEAVARSFGFEWPVTEWWEHDGTRPVRHACERAALWLTVFRQLTDWHLANSNAAFGMTAAAHAWGMLRTHMAPRSLCTHAVPETHRLERDGSYGGRASVWYFGDVGKPREHHRPDCPAPLPSGYGSIPGPLVNLDVKSMYPWLLREMSFPAMYETRRTRCRPEDAQAWAESFGVLARVTIETDVPEYPERVGDRIYYRRGRFTTVLTGPELLQLRQDGRVLKTHELATYRLGRPFANAAGALIALRESPDAANRPAWALFAKTMATALGGKLAQKKGLWEPVDNRSPPYPWGEWIEGTGRGRKPRRFRAIAGMVWQFREDDTGEGPHTAAFAYLAAYGRLHMRRIRDALPRGSVVSQDTDGLWVLPGGMGAVVGHTGDCPGRVGMLTVRTRADAARFYTPKHYWTTAGWVLAGFADPAPADDGEHITDTRRYDLHGAVSYLPPCGVSVHRRFSRLRRESHGMRIGPDGWATETARG